MQNNVGSVTIMYTMFISAEAFNEDLSRWDVRMSGMFRGADKFNGDLSSWDISFVIDMGEMLHSIEISVLWAETFSLAVRKHLTSIQIPAVLLMVPHNRIS